MSHFISPQGPRVITTAAQHASLAYHHQRPHSRIISPPPAAAASSTATATSVLTYVMEIHPHSGYDPPPLRRDAVTTGTEILLGAVAVGTLCFARGRRAAELIYRFTADRLDKIAARRR